MGHIIQWDNADKTVVLQQYLQHATKDDLYHLAQKSSSMLKTVNHPVHLIVDERNIKLTLTSSDMQFLQHHTPKNQGAVVVVVPSITAIYKNKVQGIGKLIAPNAFAETYFAETVEEAREFLAESFDVRYETFVE